MFAMTDSGSSPAEVGRMGPSTRSKNVVCTSCRQSKVRCIGSDKDTCERCVRLGLDCHRDPGFKRVSKSRKIAELEKQVQLLASTVNSPGRQSSNTSQSQPTPAFSSTATQHTGSCNHNFPGSSFGTRENAWRESLQAQPQIDPSLSNAIHSSPSTQDSFNGLIPKDLSSTSVIRLPAIMPRTIETLKLSPTQIDLLFQIFFEYYHPFLPFLDPSKSPDDYHKSGPTSSGQS